MEDGRSLKRLGVYNKGKGMACANWNFDFDGLPEELFVK